MSGLSSVLPLFMLLVAWSVDTNDKQVQKNIVTGFTIVHALLGITFVVMYLRILFTKVEGTVVAPLASYDPKDKGKTETISVREYDTRKFKELVFQKVLIPLGVILFIYTKFGTPLPLLFQCLNNPMQLYKSELFKIHVMNQAPQHELARPWTEPNPMPSWLQGMVGGNNEPENSKGSNKKKK